MSHNTSKYAAGRDDNQKWRGGHHVTQLCWICVRRLGWPYDFGHSHQIWLCHNLSLVFSVFKISVTDIWGLQWSRTGLHCHIEGLSVCPGTDSQQWSPATLLTCVGTVFLKVRFFWSWADAEELRGDLTLVDIYCFQVFSSKMKGLFTHESLMILSREAWECAHYYLRVEIEAVSMCGLIYICLHGY